MTKPLEIKEETREAELEQAVGMMANEAIAWRRLAEQAMPWVEDEEVKARYRLLKARSSSLT